jgi:hypothetical protein
MRRIIIALVALITATAQASLVGYETTISNSAPTLWYKNANTKSGEHINNSGSAGALPTTHQAYRLGGALYTDLWGNANMAFGPTNATAPAVAGSTGLFTTGAVGTVSFLFKTPDTMPAAIQTLFSQGTTFAIKLNTNGAIRIDHANSGTKYSNTVTAATGTWYYVAMKWDTTKTSNDLTWYVGAANGSLQSGNLTIASAGENTSIGLDGLKAPMQQIAIWGSELSAASIQSQFSQIPEPATIGMIGLGGLAVILLRRMRNR